MGEGNGRWGISVADIYRLPFWDSSFDLVICSEVLEHIPDDRKAMRELFRVLKPGGWSIIQVPTAPMRVVPLRMSNAAGEPPQTIGAPSWASCEMVTPLMFSAVCCTTAPAMVTGAVAPAKGIDTNSEGIQARAQSTKF